MPTLHKAMLDQQARSLPLRPFMQLLIEYGYDPHRIVGVRFDGTATGIYQGLQVDVIEDADTDPIVIRTYLHPFDDWTREGSHGPASR